MSTSKSSTPFAEEGEIVERDQDFSVVFEAPDEGEIEEFATTPDDEPDHTDDNESFVPRYSDETEESLDASPMRPNSSYHEAKSQIEKYKDFEKDVDSSIPLDTTRDDTSGFPFQGEGEVVVQEKVEQPPLRPKRKPNLGSLRLKILKSMALSKSKCETEDLQSGAENGKYLSGMKPLDSEHVDEHLVAKVSSALAGEEGCFSANTRLDEHEYPSLQLPENPSSIHQVEDEERFLSYANATENQLEGSNINEKVAEVPDLPGRVLSEKVYSPATQLPESRSDPVENYNSIPSSLNIKPWSPNSYVASEYFQSHQLTGQNLFQGLQNPQPRADSLPKMPCSPNRDSLIIEVGSSDDEILDEHEREANSKIHSSNSVGDLRKKAVDVNADAGKERPSVMTQSVRHRSSSIAEAAALRKRIQELERLQVEKRMRKKQSQQKPSKRQRMSPTSEEEIQVEKTTEETDLGPRARKAAEDVTSLVSPRGDDRPSLNVNGTLTVTNAISTCVDYQANETGASKPGQLNNIDSDFSGASLGSSATNVLLRSPAMTSKGKEASGKATGQGAGRNRFYIANTPESTPQISHAITTHPSARKPVAKSKRWKTSNSIVDPPQIIKDGNRKAKTIQGASGEASGDGNTAFSPKETLASVKNDYQRYREFCRVLLAAECALEKARERSKNARTKVENIEVELRYAKIHLAKQQEETELLRKAFQKVAQLAPKGFEMSIVTESVVKFSDDSRGDRLGDDDVLNNKSQLTLPVPSASPSNASPSNASLVRAADYILPQDLSGGDLVLMPSPFTPSGSGIYRSCLTTLRSYAFSSV